LTRLYGPTGKLILIFAPRLHHKVGSGRSSKARIRSPQTTSFGSRSTARSSGESQERTIWIRPQRCWPSGVDRQRFNFAKMPASCCLQRSGGSREAGRRDNSASLDRTCLDSVCGRLAAILAEDSNAKGIQEGKAMTVTDPKTNSMYNATASKSWIRSETRSMRLPCDRI
jgi:hypothetical protein